MLERTTNDRRDLKLETGELTALPKRFQSLETAKLARADYVFAELEGTFLDINQLRFRVRNPASIRTAKLEMMKKEDDRLRTRNRSSLGL